MQLELMKPDLEMRAHGIENTVVVFGSARFRSEEESGALIAQADAAGDTVAADRWRKLARSSHYYEKARAFGKLVAQYSDDKEPQDKLFVCTGGGPGIMQAANRGAYEGGGLSVGLAIALPMEEEANPYVTPALSFKFHYFAIRKMHFMMRAKALVAFPGGFGTLDELFEVITLVQTRKAKPVPIVLFGSDYWKQLINFEFLAEEGVISPERREADRVRRRARRTPGTTSSASTSCSSPRLATSCSRHPCGATPRPGEPVPRCFQAWLRRPTVEGAGAEAPDRRCQRHHAADDPEHAGHADQGAGGAEQHRHRDAGGIERHHAQAQRLAVPRVRRDLVQHAHHHRLHRAKRHAQHHRADAHAERRGHQRIGREHQRRDHVRRGDHAAFAEARGHQRQHDADAGRRHREGAEDGADHRGAQAALMAQDRQHEGVDVP